MSGIERHQKIIEIVQAKGYESVAALCKKLKVSAVTIRKDLKLLEKKNKLYRTHGGASNTNPFTVDRPVNEKENLQKEEKKAITHITIESNISKATIQLLLLRERPCLL